MDLINSSSIKESLYDANDPDKYGVIKLNTKKDCLDVGNQNIAPAPHVFLEQTAKDTSQLVSSHAGSSTQKRVYY